MEFLLRARNLRIACEPFWKLNFQTEVEFSTRASVDDHILKRILPALGSASHIVSASISDTLKRRWKRQK